MVNVPQICQVVACVWYPSILMLVSHKKDPISREIRAALKSEVGDKFEIWDNPLPHADTLPTAEDILIRLSQNNPIVKSVNVTAKGKPIILVPTKNVNGTWQIILKNGGRIPVRIYGDGTESRLPPLLELIVQRIQTYFSVYKFTDNSRPLAFEEAAAQEEKEKEESEIAALEAGYSSVPDDDDDYPTGEEDWIGVGDDENESYIVVGEDDAIPEYKSGF